MITDLTVLSTNECRLSEREEREFSKVIVEGEISHQIVLQLRFHHVRNKIIN